MRRREFVTLVGGAAASWPMVSYAQRRIRRISVLLLYAQDDKEGQSSVAALEQGLRDLGWTNSNLVIDYGWTASQVSRINALADEAVRSRPDLIISHATPATAAVRKLTRTLPIVFVAASDPVGDGFIESLSQPGGNLTGFINIEDSMGGKWVEILKEIDARVTRVALMFNPDTAPARGRYFERSFFAAAKLLNIEPILAAVRSDADIEGVISRLGGESGGALIATADGFNVVHRRTIITEAARHRIPAIYHLAVSAREGGLVTYGANTQDIFRRSAAYVDRVLRGESPANLPAQVPTKFQFVINLKVARTLGLTVPPTLLARADEVIE